MTRKRKYNERLLELMEGVTQEARPDPTWVESPHLRAKMDELHSNPSINQMLNDLWLKDPYTYGHSHRVADFAQWIGRSLGLSDQERVELYLCGLLHDIGKIKTPDSVLKKPGPLTAEEFVIIKKHPVDSGDMIKIVPDIAYLADAIRGHHERIDGKGYPDQKMGDDIHIYSRIILVADTFDAMTTNRVYRKQLELERTYEEINRCAGTQFDPEAARAFIAAHQKYVFNFSLKKAA